MFGACLRVLTQIVSNFLVNAIGPLNSLLNEWYLVVFSSIEIEKLRATNLFTFWECRKGEYH